MSTATQQRTSAYWCHICSAEVPIYMAPDPTCQRCNEQFIEEVHSDDDPRAFLNDGENDESQEDHHPFLRPEGAQYFTFTSRTREHSPGEIEEDEIFRFFSPRTSNNNNNNNNSNNANNNDNNTTSEERRGTGEGQSHAEFLNLLQGFLTNFVGENVATRGSADQPYIVFGDAPSGFRFRSNRPLRTPTGESTGTNEHDDDEDDEDDEDDDDENPTTTTTNNNNNESEGGRGGGGRGGSRANSINSFLQYISALTGNTFDGGMVGNPNDYVFSQGALDNIITQLMEQTSGASAPAPASEQVIDSLKQRTLTDEEARQETDCAVCKDTFVPEENVIELPCEHIFHDECIKPWLKLNGTCPVCRHSVAPEKKQGDKSTNESTNNSNNNGNQGVQGGSSNTTTWFMGGSGETMAGAWPSERLTQPPSMPRRFNSNTSNVNRESNQNTRNNQNDDPMDVDLD